MWTRVRILTPCWASIEASREYCNILKIADRLSQLVCDEHSCHWTILCPDFSKAVWISLIFVKRLCSIYVKIYAYCIHCCTCWQINFLQWEEMFNFVLLQSVVFRYNLTKLNICHSQSFILCGYRLESGYTCHKVLVHPSGYFWQSFRSEHYVTTFTAGVMIVVKDTNPFTCIHKKTRIAQEVMMKYVWLMFCLSLIFLYFLLAFLVFLCNVSTMWEEWGEQLEWAVVRPPCYQD